MGATCSVPSLQDSQELYPDRQGAGDMSLAGAGGGGSPGTSSRRGGGGGPSGGSKDAFVSEWQNGKEKAREWQRQIKTEIRQLDRDMNQIRREEEKLKREIKLLAKQGKAEQVQNTAKNVVRLRRSVARLEKTKNSMTAMNLHLTTQIATMSSASAVKVSTAMMKEANQILNVQEMQRTMEEMQAEMAKAQIADEVMEEGFSDPEDETEIDSELRKVYDEVALDASLIIGTAPGGGTGQAVPSAGVAAPQAYTPQYAPSPFATLPPEDASLEQDDPLRHRLEALR